jgi:eukaryotic-like serine/threonine-protein kinase
MRFCTGCGLSTDSFNTKTENVNAQVTAPPAAASTDPLVGRVLDSKYELGERLGEGGMGAVYRARRLHIGDEVAVKVLHQQFVRESGGLERFRREARSAALIRHTNVVAIHDFSEARGDDASAYIVMELVRGKSLRDLLRQEGRLEPERAVALMRDICAGVGVAHRQGIVHRDLKPDNVIVVPPDVEGEREMAKVLDFGLAKLRDSAAELTLTQTGAVMGTPYYMSPEQWRGESLDSRSDVYSLGAMLYEMLTASPPFNSTSAAGLMVKHMNEAPPDLESYLQISPALETVCQRALSKTPEERQADAAVLSRELQAALTTPPITQPWVSARHPGVSPAPLTPSQMVTLRDQRPNRLKWVIAAGLLTLLIATVITMLAVSYLTKDKITSDNSATTSISNGNVAVVPSAADGARSNEVQSLMGTWTGAYGPLGTSTRLVIKEHNRDRWSGVLEQGSVRVAFTGTIDVASRKVTFKETELISGDGWSLGDNTGEISSDGRMMSGTGKDAMGAQLGISYQWSFSKR